MAATLNPSDLLLSTTSPRLVTVSLANNLLFSGNVTGSVNNVAVGDITGAITNFNSSNDQINTAIPAATAGTIVHSTNDDGSVNVTFPWTWSGTESQIDGFIFTSIARTQSGGYTINNTPAEETSVVVPANKRAHVLYGVAVNRYFTFGVRAYRRVATNINSSGLIVSNLVQNGPYQPSSSVAVTVGLLNGSGIGSYQNSSVVLGVDAANGNISLNNAGGGSLTGIINSSRPITAGNIPTYIDTGAISDTYIGNLSAGKINTGTLNAGLITVTNLSASSINTGTLNAGLITVNNLSASSINTGTLNAGLITVNNLSASSINTGTLNAGVVSVTNLNADNITAGTIAANRITTTTLQGKTVTAGTVVVGVIDANHYGISLNGTDFANFFGKRLSDGVVFLQVNANVGGFGYGLNFNSVSGISIVTPQLTISGGSASFAGTITAGTITAQNIISTGNISQNSVSIYYNNQSAAGASSFAWVIGPMPANSTGFLVEYSLGPETFTGGGDKYTGGVSVTGPILAGLNWNGTSLFTTFVPASYYTPGSINTLNISRTNFAAGSAIKISITFLFR